MADNFILHNGVRRYLGCLPGKSNLAGPSFGASRQLSDRSDWTDGYDLSNPAAAPVLDQGQTQACVGFACYAAFTLAWLVSGGKEERFSPWFVWGRLGGGQDKSPVGVPVSIGAAVDILKTTGICLDADVSEGMVFSPGFPNANPPASASQFRVLNWIPCGNFDEIGNAIQLNFPVAFGIQICDNFANLPDAAGIFPDPQPGALIWGHAMCVVGIKKISGKWYAKVQNSYGNSFGRSGFAYMPESYFDSETSWAIDVVSLPLDPT